MPLIGTKAAASSQGFGQFAESGAEAVYIEDVFSTYLYTGNGSTQTITNGIDLAGEGGLVWIKSRSAGTSAYGHYLASSNNFNKYLQSNTTGAQLDATGLFSVSSTGFTLGNDYEPFNFNAATYASWTFRKQPKFFDIVTYTGNGVTGRTVAHDLGSVPGCIIVKRTDSTGDWAVYHRGVNGGTNPQDYKILLNLTNAQALDNWWNNTLPTSSSFQLSSDPTVNQNGATYVAYLFAHDAGGFGLEGTDDVISCGSFVSTGTAIGNDVVVNLGYEVQYVLLKANNVSNWQVYDTMRGLSVTGTQLLYPNTSDAEVDGGSSFSIEPTATGFTAKRGLGWGSGTTVIYIAIRRGPMKVPTSGTEVFSPVKATFSGTTVTNTGFVVDMVINKTGVATADNNFVLDRLRGSNNGAGQTTLPSTSSQSAEVASSGRVAFTGSVTIQNGFLQQDTRANNIVWAFKRAPGFFDEVCYTGTGVARTVAHNLAAVPELMIVKVRTGSAGESWTVWNKTIATSNAASTLWLNSTSSVNLYSNRFNSTAPTSSVFTVGNDGATNGSTWTYVAYLFATLAGVSKVGSYTGTGTTQTINCGFTAGARFVMIKRTDSTGDWYVWDSARGIVAGNDPYLLLNEAAAEVTSTDYIDTASTGFEISSTAPAAINANGGSFIFLAIA